MHMASRFRTIENRCRASGKTCRAFGRGYTYTHRDNRFTWSESFASGACRSLCSNLNIRRSFRQWVGRTKSKCFKARSSCDERAFPLQWLCECQYSQRSFLMHIANRFKVLRRVCNAFGIGCHRANRGFSAWSYSFALDMPASKYCDQNIWHSFYRFGVQIR
jgi:hypothetical protein